MGDQRSQLILLLRIASKCWRLSKLISKQTSLCRHLGETKTSKYVKRLQFVSRRDPQIQVADFLCQSLAFIYLLFNKSYVKEVSFSGKTNANLRI